jgi:hypothetical protein
VSTKIYIVLRTYFFENKYVPHTNISHPIGPTAPPEWAPPQFGNFWPILMLNTIRDLFPFWHFPLPFLYCVYLSVQSSSSFMSCYLALSCLLPKLSLRVRAYVDCKNVNCINCRIGSNYRILWTRWWSFMFLKYKDFLELQNKSSSSRTSSRAFTYHFHMTVGYHHWLLNPCSIADITGMLTHWRLCGLYFTFYCCITRRI